MKKCGYPKKGKNSSLIIGVRREANFRVGEWGEALRFGQGRLHRNKGVLDADGENVVEAGGAQAGNGA